MSLTAIVLAAGKGTRMKSDLPKVLHKVNGIPMIEKILREVRKTPAGKIVLVLGHGADLVGEVAKKHENITTVLQKEQLGTGHAVLQAKAHFGDPGGDVMILYGDTPLLRNETLTAFYETFRASGAGACVMTAVVENPFGYGRVLTKGDEITSIVEEKDAAPEQKAVREINAGVYCFKAADLASALDNITNDNEKKEYYLTDAIGLLGKAGKKVVACRLDDPAEVMGINSKVELALAAKVLRQRKNRSLMEQGVLMIDPDAAYVEEDVSVGRDTLLWPGVLLQGRAALGANCEIIGNTRIIDSTVGDHVRIESSVIEQSVVENGVTIGPFAHLRPLSHLKENVHIGNFVETKKSTLEKGVKSGHLTYLGDAHIGENTNIGAGTITCNYDGTKKNPTTIGKNAFIGSDSILVAPVAIGDGAYIGAGSVITKQVPENALSVERNKQLIKTNWRKKENEGN